MRAVNAAHPTQVLLVEDDPVVARSLQDGLRFDFCRKMHLSGLRQPILMLTVQGEEMVSDGYITKPFSLRELLSRIRPQLCRL